MRSVVAVEYALLRTEARLHRHHFRLCPSAEHCSEGVLAVAFVYSIYPDLCTSYEDLCHMSCAGNLRVDNSPYILDPIPKQCATSGFCLPHLEPDQISRAASQSETAPGRTVQLAQIGLYAIELLQQSHDNITSFRKSELLSDTDPRSTVEG